MGCRHYFVVDRLEDLVDEGDSRCSSRAHEHDNFRLVSQLHVAIQTPQNRCPSSCVDEPVGCPLTTGLTILSRSASTSLSVSLSFSKRSTNKLVFLQSRGKRVSISWALERDVCSVTTGLPVLQIGLGFGWVGWLSSACRATSEPNSFIQSFLKEIFGGGRGDSYTFSYMISVVSIRTAFGIQ